MSARSKESFLQHKRMVAVALQIVRRGDKYLDFDYHYDKQHKIGTAVPLVNRATNLSTTETEGAYRFQKISAALQLRRLDSFSRPYLNFPFGHLV